MCGCDCCPNEDEEEQEEQQAYSAPAPSAYRPAWRDAEPANEEQARVWGGIVDGLLSKYKAVNLPAAISIVCQEVGVRAENFVKLSQQIERFIRESPAFELRKGKFGGVFKAQPKLVLTPQDYHGTPVPMASVTTDNYTCKGCGNTKLHDTNDKSCWKCGRTVGT